MNCQHIEQGAAFVVDETGEAEAFPFSSLAIVFGELNPGLLEGLGSTVSHIHHSGDSGGHAGRIGLLEME